VKPLLFLIAGFILISCQNQPTESINHKSEPPRTCTDDLKTCQHGRSVGRNPHNHCEFYACDNQAIIEQSQVMCTQEVKLCADGSYVGRDASNNCEFSACPDGDKNLK